MNNNPEIVVGVKQIAAFYQCSPRTVQRRLEEMKNAGVVFRRWVGRPPKRIWSAYRDKLLEYAHIFWGSEIKSEKK